MNRFLLLTTLALAPRLAFAQAEGKPPEATAKITTPEGTYQPRFKLNQGNLGALALVGDFYSKVERAETFQGEMVMTKTLLKDGKEVGRKVMSWKSAWTGNGAGWFAKDKSRYEASYTETKDGLTTTRQGLSVTDGDTKTNFSATRKLWSTEPNDESSDLAEVMVTGLWTTTIFFFDAGTEWKVLEQRQGRQGGAANHASLIVSDETGYEAVFDRETHLLERWTLKGKDEITEVKFLNLKLNQPLAPDTFTLAIPKDTRKVEPKEMENKFEF